MKHHPQNKQNIPLSPAVQSVVDAFRQAGTETDPEGCYTGVPREAKDLGVQIHPDKATPGAKQFVVPTQDADDL